jgi:hypothetical protein
MTQISQLYTQVEECGKEIETEEQILADFVGIVFKADDVQSCQQSVQSAARTQPLAQRSKS